MLSQISSLKLKMGLYLKRESFFASVPLDARCAPSFESCRVISHECCKHLLLLLTIIRDQASYPLPSLPPQDKCSIACAMHSYFTKIGHSSRPKNDLTYHRIQKLHEEAVSLVLRHPDLGLWKTRSDRNQHGSMRKFFIILRENITIHTRSPILSNNSPPAQYSRKMNCLSPDSSDLAP